jgi:hypothetical protein
MPPAWLGTLALGTSPKRSEHIVGFGCHGSYWFRRDFGIISQPLAPKVDGLRRPVGIAEEQAGMEQITADAQKNKKGRRTPIDGNSTAGLFLTVAPLKA